MIIQLFDEFCPKTSENFRQLCEGFQRNPSSPEKIGYQGTEFHRVVKDMYIQGGDLSKILRKFFSFLLIFISNN